MERALSEDLPDTLPPFKHHPLGDAALVISFEHRSGPLLQQHIQALIALLKPHAPEGLLDWVQAYNTLTLYYCPWLMSAGGLYDPYQRLLTALRQLWLRSSVTNAAEGKLMEIPVCYGGSFGPDLAFVAAHAGLSPKAIIDLHSTTTYWVEMIGFLPGFPYLGGMDKRIEAPRKAVPALRVAAGAVGIGGRQTGIYPRESPGGWQIIGRSTLKLFSAYRQPPNLLQPGDRVRFVPIPPEDFGKELHEP